MGQVNDSDEEWDEFYRKYAPDRLPWERGRPDTNLVSLVEKGIIEKEKERNSYLEYTACSRSMASII